MNKEKITYIFWFLKIECSKTQMKTCLTLLGAVQKVGFNILRFLEIGQLNMEYYVKWSHLNRNNIDKFLYGIWTLWFRLVYSAK